MKRLVGKFAIDMALWILAIPIAYWLRLDSQVMAYTRPISILLLLAIPVFASMLYGLGLHRQSWHKVGVRDLLILMRAIGVGTGALMIAAFFFPRSLPRSIPLIEGMLALVSMGGARMLCRIIHEHRGQQAAAPAAQRVLVAGAGEAGTMMAREMLRHPEGGMMPVGFIDDDPAKRVQRFLGLPVLGDLGDLGAIVAREQIDEVVIAIPSAPGALVRKLVEQARAARVRHRILPGVYEILSGKVSISQLREIDLEDLLRREPVQFDLASIAGYLEDRVVLITGAGGSIGAEIVRQVIRFRPQKLVLLGRGENSIYDIEQELRRSWPDQKYQTVIADIRDTAKVEHAFRTHKPQVVFQAAAHKHVPLMEHNSDEAIFNNVRGTKNLAEAALRHGVERFVNISTDKAVNPSSIMGASKRVAEYLVESASRRCAPGQRFVSVRFGNVLGSRGSVVPLFKQQIRQGGPVTLTHPEMQRYFMTIPEAAQLVLQAAGLGENGAVYVLDMGEPVRIADLARDLIRLSGLEPGVDVEIVYTGLRPGEKLYEELLTAEEGTVASRHQKIFVANRTGLPFEHLDALVEELFEAAGARQHDWIKDVLRKIIPTYQRPEPVTAVAAAGGGARRRVEAVASGRVLP